MNQKRRPIRSKALRNAARGQRCILPNSVLFERMMDKVAPEPNSGCWLWMGRDNQNGYGSMWNGVRSEYAHRLSYRLHKGAIPSGLVVCHSCDIRPCVNPDHLWLGTSQDNIMDCVAKGRHVPADIAGIKNPKVRLTPEQVREVRSVPQHYGVDIAFARKFGVSKATISHIRGGRTWKAV